MAGITGGGRTLVVNLVADTKRFGAGINNAKRDIGGLRGSINRLGSMAGPALAGATAMVGAFATKLAVDGVKAAADEEQAVRQLDGVLKNLGFPNATQQVEDWISSQQQAVGVSDNELRPAFQRLMLSTKDVEDAQKLANLAMDISAATGKPLEGVANALGKAYDGNVGALGRLGLGLDAATLKSGDMNSITKELADRFGGSAAANADTYKGKIDRLTEGFGELQESFGQGFLDGLSAADDGMGDLAGTMFNAQGTAHDLGKSIGDLVGPLTTAFGFTQDLKNMTQELYDTADQAPILLQPFIKGLENLNNPLSAVKNLTYEIVHNIEILQGAWDKLFNNNPGIGGGGGGGSWGNGNARPAQAPRPTGAASGYTPGASTRSVFDKNATDQPTIIIQAGVGDPVAIAREVDRVLRLSNTRLGA